ncbi:hypothetical protein BDV38DRAFT_2253 [Aspergillus pseudotamarii]|uniref:Cyanovirin-N domain-containing protein n=1 Tax=Aspergillus pseudotamarii TaxID=132259 RepID=A0A5N6TBU8_ASPPS|nr:uncharacterized protein BDV38DRAFT_2253 [Aspergillus pseudotamarii]KAE8143750.1 hypothetical protein BDV38DRAFT_2253 [Aspergillus pseudotamarii]
MPFRSIHNIKLIIISSPKDIHLPLPFIILPVAALAVPQQLQDLPAEAVPHPRRPPVKPTGHFTHTCRDVKFDGEKDTMHKLIATCAVGDGTEVTSKLDLSQCYSTLSRRVNECMSPGNGSTLRILVMCLVQSVSLWHLQLLLHRFSANVNQCRLIHMVRLPLHSMINCGMITVTSDVSITRASVFRASF